MKVKIKKLDRKAILPKYSKLGDAGMDLVAIDAKIVKDDYIEYSTGLSIEIPKGFVGLVFPRSSISETKMSLCNSVGVIDSGYRGEIKCRFRDDIIAYPKAYGEENVYYGSEGCYEAGNRIAQLIIIPYPEIEFEVVDELSDSDRGEGGFGSTNLPEIPQRPNSPLIKRKYF